MPCTISVVASKGGVGKSLITACLAAHAAKRGFKVGIHDLDAQHSATIWHRARGSPSNPALLPELGKPGRGGPDVTLIDTPPSNLRVIKRAIDACDVAIIPVRAGFFDIAAVTDVIEMCKDAGRFFLLVLNAVEPRRRQLVSESMAALNKLGPTFDRPLEERAVYVTTLHHGKTGPEATPADDNKRSSSALRLDAEGAAEEIAALWDAALVVLKHARKSQ